MWVIIRKSDNKPFSDPLKTIGQANYWLDRLRSMYPRFDFEIKASGDVKK